MAADEPYTDPFWEALEDGHFLLHECTDCGHTFFPPGAGLPGLLRW